MAFNHISFNDQLPHGRLLRSMLNGNERGDDEMRDVRNVMIQMCEAGNPGVPENFSEVVVKFGFDSNEKAFEAFKELDSAYAKTSGNEPVEGVRAARDQLYDKLR